MFDRLGRLVARHPRKIALAWLIASGLLTWLSPKWEDRCQDDEIHFLPGWCLSVHGHQLLSEAFPQEVFGSKAIFAFERQGGALTPEDYALVRRFVAAAEDLHRESGDLPLGAVRSFLDPMAGSRLKSADGRCTLVMVAIRTPFLAFRTGEAVRDLEDRLAPLLEEYRRDEAVAGRDPAALRVLTTGPSGMGRDLNAAVFASLDQTTVATVVLVVAILLLVYRSPALALVPLVTIGGSVWVALRVLAILSLWPEFQVVNITRAFIVVVLYGAGTDYCLFLISRYREELQRGLGVSEAVAASLKRVGWALTASAGTVVVGLGMMGFAEFAKLRYTGPAIALSLVFALAASMTLAPALLRLLGPWAFWPRRLTAVAAGTPGRGATASLRFWEWVSDRVAARPGTVWLTSVAILVPLAVLGYRTQHVYDFSAELPRDAASRTGLDVIRRHFPPGEIGPTTVLLRTAGDWAAPAGRAALAELTAELSAVPNVVEVRSLTQPLGPGVPAETGGGLVGRLKATLADRAAQAFYVAAGHRGSVTRLDLVFGTEPFAMESVATMYDVKAALDRWSLARSDLVSEAGLYGVSVLTGDVAALQESDRRLINSLIVAGIFLILVVVVRRPWVAAYLLASVLFSYYVTIGATELLSWGWLDAGLGKVDWKVPYFLFTILVAIGEDYNIFLLTRVIEEAKRNGLRRGTQLALARTGGTISSCGLIMAGTFAALMLADLLTLVQLGLALAFGVLLDTFIVRPVLVPAFLLLIARDRPGPANAPAAPVPDVPLRRSA